MKKGDRVILLNLDGWHSRNTYNPLWSITNAVGSVVHHGRENLHVIWDAGHHGIYTESCLGLYKKEIIKEILK